MIPAIVAAPVVQGVVGGVVGQVMNAFAPAPTAASSSAFNTYIDRVARPSSTTPVDSPSGTIHSTQWNHMDSKSVQSWAQSLTGRHVDATDDSGRTISGIVGGVKQMGNTLALQIGSHFVSLSQLKQINWSPSVA